ncbi:MAG: hypothetical protein GF364_04600 [Candidatus Lokiarchaeota archaeon]|nr:hypothetical protein [Candidatus Lokiarchaeota archaeon]
MRKYSKKAISFMISIVCCSTLIITVLSINFFLAKAYLISPRLGTPLCFSASDGTGASSPILNTESIYIGSDPAEVNVPNAWLDKSKWDVAISHSMIDNCSLIELEIKSISKCANPYVSIGIGDSSILSRNAIEMKVSIPLQVDACLYDLYVGYNIDLTTVSDLSTEPGAHIGETILGNLKTGSFVLSEANAIYVPHEDDATPSEPAKISDQFSMIQITDVHTATDSSGEWSNYLKMKALAESISIWAPDVIIGTGDITNAPDDWPIEYLRSYDYYKNLGIPIIMANGNHDHSNLGLWDYYFGPIYSNIDWMGARFLQINTATMLKGQTVNWVTQSIKKYAPENPLFVTCHIPLIDVLGRQSQGYSASIMDAMLKYGGTAVLQGHNHYDMVMDGDKALNNFLNLMKTSLTTMEIEYFDDACHTPDNVGIEAPDTDVTKMIITTSAAKNARPYKLTDSHVWDDYQGYLGYRRITLADNKIANYTYDLNEDGLRDPSYSTPIWNLGAEFSFDEYNLAGGANYTITNNLTESIPNARVPFILPLQIGQTWQPKPSMGTEGVDYFLRVSVSNSTHEYREYRFKVPKRLDSEHPTIKTFEMELV